MNKMHTRLGAILLAGATLLSACGGGAASSSTSAPASVAASSAASASNSSAAIPPASGVASGATSGGTIKIGVLEPLTGPLAEVGKNNEEGFNLYLDTVNHTIAGHKVQAIYSDTQGKADVGLTKAKQLVESNGVQILAGITATPVCYAVAGYVKQAHVPLAVTGNCGAQNIPTTAKFSSPYFTRFSQNTVIVGDPAAAWAYSQGHHKASIIVSNFGGGLEVADAFARTFIANGGSVVQEQYPAQGTTDYGPLLSQINPSADVIVAFLPGTDGLRFMTQYGNYVTTHKPIIDLYGAITDGPNLAQLKDKGVGVTGVFVYSTAIDNAQNKQFLQLFHQKYPNQLVTKDAVQGYSGAEIIAAALDKVNGNVSKSAVGKFMDALYATNAQTPKGQVRLDKNHDLVQNIYVYQVVKQGSGFGQKLLHTYDNVSSTWDITPQQLAKFKIGQMKGQWVGMTKAKLHQLGIA